MIVLRDLTVFYRNGGERSRALNNVNLSLPEGGTCAVIGPSGCGKSTLLKTMAGIITDYEGQIQFRGEGISPMEQVIGFIPQNYGLLPWKTVYENIVLGTKLKRKKTDREETKRIMRQLGIAELGGRYPRQLSGGQQQRVSLARAFLLAPDLLLMDEPFSALDAITREEIQDLFLSVWQQRAVTTFLVTHYVEEAVYLGQKIIVLSRRSGSIAEVVDNPLFGGKDIRGQRAFFELCSTLRNLIKEDGSA